MVAVVDDDAGVDFIDVWASEEARAASVLPINNDLTHSGIPLKLAIEDGPPVFGDAGWVISFFENDRRVAMHSTGLEETLESAIGAAAAAAEDYVPRNFFITWPVCPEHNPPLVVRMCGERAFWYCDVDQKPVCRVGKLHTLG